MIAANIDVYDVITQNAKEDWDGGDTIQREGMLQCAMWYHRQAGRLSQIEWEWMHVRYLSVIDKLNYSNGWSLRRHPNTAKWYGDADRMSRDQLTSNICALGFSDQATLKQLIVKHLLRLGLFTTNTHENGAVKGDGSLTWSQRIQYIFGLYTSAGPIYSWKLPDITDPSIWGAYVRGMNWKLLWPMLWLSDLVLLVTSLTTIYKTKQDPTFCDHLSFQMLMLQAHYQMPTWISKLAMWAYRKYSSPQAALDLYFDPSKNGPALNEVYREIWASL